MASLASNSETVKQLKDHLKDPQEPFNLNTYLSERGYSVKCLSSNGRNGCCQLSFFKNLNKKMGLLSAKIVKSIAYKLVSANGSQEIWCCSELQTSETNSSSEVNGVTPFGASPLHSWRTSQATSLGNEEQEKVLTDKTCQRKCAPDKQFNSLMSILNKLSSDKLHQIITKQETPLIENAGDKFTFTRYSFIGFKEAKEIIDPSSPKLQGNKEHVNQTKPCKEYVRNMYNYIHWFIGMEKQGNLITAEEIYSFRFRKNYFSSMDFSDTLKKWKFPRKLQTKIGFELGDSIMDDIIEEIVIDSLQHYH